MVNAIGGSSVRVAGVSSLPAAHNPSDALIEPGTEDKPKTRKQIRRTVRTRKHRANRKEKKARVKLESATGAGEVPVVDLPHQLRRLLFHHWNHLLFCRGTGGGS